MRIFLAAMAAACLGLPASAQASSDEWAGVYKVKHNIGFSDDTESYSVENILEIVPVSPTQAYVRTMIFEHNADRCNFYGVAQVEGDRLIYRGPMREFVSYDINSKPPKLLTTTKTDRCELVISRSADGAGGSMLQLNDRDQLCKRSTCGYHAYFDRQTWPATSRREIRYMDRLKASKEYAEAMAEAGLSPKP